MKIIPAVAFILAAIQITFASEQSSDSPPSCGAAKTSHQRKASAHGITQEQLLLAIYNDYQLHNVRHASLPSSSDFKGFFSKAKEDAKKGTFVSSMGKIPVCIDFRSWPNLDSTQFNARLGVVKRRTLEEIIKLLQTKKDIRLSRVLSDEEIQTTTWTLYTENDKTTTPEKATQRALELISHYTTMPEFVAIDLGAGKGRDTQFLLSHGAKRVLAIESNPAAVHDLRRLQAKYPNQLFIQSKDFQHMDLREITGPVHLINASYALPYAGRMDFSQVWKKISDRLLPDGFFSGQFFGPESDHARSTDIATQDWNQILNLLSEFQIEYCREIKGQSASVDKGEIVRWHVFDIVARKLVSSSVSKKTVACEKATSF